MFCDLSNKALDWRQLEVSQRHTTLNALKDPLVLSLDGKIADLTEARVTLDIDQESAGPA